MAEQIPYGVASSIITKLASLAFHEIRQIYGVSEDLDKLKETITDIKVVLSDAEKKQEQVEAVKIWIRRFKEVLHNADDLLDDYRIEDLRRKRDGNVKSKVSSFFSSLNPIVFRHKMAHKIRNIRKQLDGIEKHMSVLKLIQRPLIPTDGNVCRETDSLVLESDIIGREESKMKIVSLLKETHSNQNVSLVAIVGIGGLGKTALAKLVYNDTGLQEFFQKKMWVCVSQDFERKTLLTKMLKSLKIDIVGDLELDQLQQKLQESLNGQKFLLVLDDVWNESNLKWDAMRTYLMCGAQSSKILVTTRSEFVAQTMGVNDTYILEGLTKEQSWDLLKKVVFGEDSQKMNQNLLSIGESIAEKCRGVPLAITTIGGILKSQNEEKQWSNILNGDFWRPCKDEESIMPVLKLSYQNLPIELRQCFAYCAVYPKDWEIEKDDLILLWMAQGYLECSTANECMEDLGDRYVKTLLMRSFFQDVVIDRYGDIASFKMHDLMHDLAMLVAGNDFYTENEGKRIVGRPMHMSFEDGKDFPSLESQDQKRLRTILEIASGYDYLQFDIVKKLHDISNFKSLRVLKLSNSTERKLPKSIGKLKHLKLLDLTDYRALRELPKSMENLVGLEVLKLRECDKLEFPTQKIVPRLISLRHLDIDYCKAFEKMMPAGLGRLSSLQYLSTFVVGEASEKNCGKLNELKDLNNLRGQFTIRNLKFNRDVVSESAEANLEEKRYLRSLRLRWAADGNIGDSDGNLQLLENLRPNQNLKELSVSTYPGEKFSHWLSLLTNIVSLWLDGFPKCQHLPPLELFPLLKNLRIREMPSLEFIYYESNAETLYTETTFFRSLETLSLPECPKLRGWQRMIDVKDNTSDIEHRLPSFPRLSSLNIFDCPRLTCMPTFPHLNERLLLSSNSVKPLLETLQLQSSSSVTPLSKLKSLTIRDMDIGGALPDKWMQNLTSLQRLRVSNVLNIFGHMQHVPALLQELHIELVDELEVSMQTQPLHWLHSLQTIDIGFCDSLMALPEWICDLSSLTLLRLRFCKRLESLPEGMPRLTNLQTLYVLACPLLREKCKRDTGADWLKIAHIPNIMVNGSII